MQRMLRHTLPQVDVPQVGSISCSGLRQEAIVQDVIARMLVWQRMLLHTLLLACCQPGSTQA